MTITPPDLAPTGFASAATRFLVTLLLGPALGVLVFVIVLATPHLLRGTIGELISQPYLGPVLGMGYMFGLVPALLGALALAAFARFKPAIRSQLVATLPIGGVAGLFGMQLVTIWLFGSGEADPMWNLTTILAGGLSLLICNILYFSFSGARRGGAV